jgi:hypothetical protein
VEGAKQQQHRFSASPKQGSENLSCSQEGSCDVTQDEVLRRESSGPSGSPSILAVVFEVCLH